MGGAQREEGQSREKEERQKRKRRERREVQERRPELQSTTTLRVTVGSM